MTQDYLEWTHTCPHGHEIRTRAAKDANGKDILQIACLEITTAPLPTTISGKIIAGDIIFDSDIDAWVLKDVELEPLT